MVNGVTEVEAAVRMRCKRGASQIKLALGGGVISASDPIDTLQYTPDEIRAAVQVAQDRVAAWAKAHGTQVAFGTDLLFQPEGTKSQPVLLTRFARVFGNVGTLRIATSGNCELFALSGVKNSYGEAQLGVIQEGAWADVLPSEGDPTQDINVLKDYEGNLRVTVKNEPSTGTRSRHGGGLAR